MTNMSKVSARFSKSFGETPVSSEPGEGALDHPAAWQDDKALHIVAPLDDLHAQRWHLCRPLTFPTAITVGPRGRE